MSRLWGANIHSCFLILLFSCIGQVRAQYFNLPQEYQSSVLTQKLHARRDSVANVGIQPFIPLMGRAHTQVTDSYNVFKFIKEDPAIDLIFRNHLIRVAPKKEDFVLTIDPILNLEMGRDFNDSAKRNLYTNTRGFIAGGRIGKNFYFETMFAESQSLFPEYVSSYNVSSHVVPGQGRFKTFKTSGFDYAFASGMISMRLWKNGNLQLGHGKHKIGHGYRSLLLSDNSMNYPFLRFTQEWWRGKLRYTNVYASLMNLVQASSVVNPYAERIFQKKSAAWQYLELSVTRAFQASLFQGLIWEAGDYRNQQHLNFNYFNPVIFANTAVYGLDNKNNILIGGDVLFKLNDKVNAYGQWMLDHVRPDSAGFGWQGGLKWFDFMRVKNLFVQMEYNRRENGSYQAPPGVNVSQAYNHYGEGLVVLPARQELVVISNFRFERILLQGQYNFQSDAALQRHILQGKVGYLINPSYNLTASINFTYRTGDPKSPVFAGSAAQYLYFAIRTNLFNYYYDF